MPEEVLFEDERRQERGEIADYLRAVADKLDAGEPITLAAGERSVTVEPPARPTFEVKVERETSRGGGPDELSIELELEWDEGVEGAEGGADGSLSIE
jgi:amphi-Trp domain-containing protein